MNLCATVIIVAFSISIQMNKINDTLKLKLVLLVLSKLQNERALPWFQSAVSKNRSKIICGDHENSLGKFKSTLDMKYKSIDANDTGQSNEQNKKKTHRAICALNKIKSFYRDIQLLAWLSHFIFDLFVLLACWANSFFHLHFHSNSIFTSLFFLKKKSNWIPSSIMHRIQTGHRSLTI